MLSATGSSTNANPAGAGASAAALQAQLDRYQKQLSDCVNCASAKTQAGKTAIQDLSGKISAIKARIAAIPAAKSNASAPNANGGAAANKRVPASGAQNSPSISAASAGYAITAVGGLLNVYA